MWEGTPLRPIISSINSPTTPISRLLDSIIRPLFNKHTRSTTVHNGFDLIQRFEMYTSEHRLNSKTLFCTFDITDLYTMLPQEESLDILTAFLLEHDYRKIQNVPSDAIRKLARVVLTENAFIYNKKYYKQIVGGAMGSPFTLTLANIFMWQWEKKIVERQFSLKEIYCRYILFDIFCVMVCFLFKHRYIDDVFFTSNESLQIIKKLLDQMNNFHPNIKLTRQIDTKLPFLDVLLSNNNGILFTSIHHKEAAETQTVPFMSDHPRHIFNNIIKGFLTRAIRYSSTLTAFNEEQRLIKLKLLYNN